MIAVLAWLVVSAALVGTAYRDLTSGRSQILALRGNVSSAALQSGALDDQLGDATKALQRGHGKLANPLLAPFRLLPVAGRQLSSAIAISGTAATAADVASSSLKEARAVAPTLKSDRAGGLQKLSQIAGDADKRLLATSLGPNDALATPLAEARNQIADQLRVTHTTLQRASAGAGAMAALLSTDSKYLVIAANNGEMRAGAGMFLSAGILTTGNGQLSLDGISTVGTLNAPKGSVTWPKDMADRWGWIGFQSDMRNLMMSPRFDQSAPLAADVWKAAGKGDVDGVLVIDPVMLQSILKATGSVQAGDLTVDANNILDQLLIEQYKSINLKQSTVEAQESRREGLAGVASAVFGSLNDGGWNPVVMARELGSAADGRHVLVWAKDPQRNQQWVDAGMGGTMSTDSMMLSSLNVGANKLDQFMKTDATMEEKLGANGIEVSVKITMTNTTPSDAPGYVLGPTPGVGLVGGEYAGLLSMNVPQDARDLRFDGNQKLVALGADGPNQTIGTAIRVKLGQSVTYTVRFTRSATAQKTIVESAGRYPATTWHDGGQTWTDDKQHVLVH